MAFFDKVNSIAKNIGDVANDTIESTKLTVKLQTEKSLMEAEWKRIGAFYYQKHRQGEILDEGVRDFLEAADSHRKRIEELEQTVKELKAARAQKEADRSRGEEPVDAQVVEHPEKETAVCPACGKENAAHIRYCVYCGEELTIPAEEAAAESEEPQRSGKEARFCQNCGRELAPGMNFCPECGAKVEA